MRCAQAELQNIITLHLRAKKMGSEEALLNVAYAVTRLYANVTADCHNVEGDQAPAGPSHAHMVGGQNVAHGIVPNATVVDAHLEEAVTCLTTLREAMGFQVSSCWYYSQT
jgi:hypothetical protein